MTKYEIMYEALQDKVNSGELTVEDAEILNDIVYERYADNIDYNITYDEYLESMEYELFNEGFVKKGMNFLDKHISDNFPLVKATDMVNKGMNLSSKALATGTMALTGNRKKSCIYEEYKKKLDRWMTMYKSVQLGILEVLGCGPVDWVLTVCFLKTWRKSNDDIDKKSQEFIENFGQNVKDTKSTIKNKLKSLIKKVKNKEISKQQAEAEFKVIDTMTSKLAKDMDKYNNKITEKVTKESLETMLISGEVTTESYDLLNDFISVADINDEHNVLLIEACLELLENNI